MSKNSTIMHLPLDTDTANWIDYWTEKGGFKSKREFTRAAIKQYIAIQNGDMSASSDLETRVSQLTGEIDALSVQIETLSKIVDTGFKTILNLTDDDI